LTYVDECEATSERTNQLDLEIGWCIPFPLETSSAAYPNLSPNFTKEEERSVLSNSDSFNIGWKPNASALVPAFAVVSLDGDRRAVDTSATSAEEDPKSLGHPQYGLSSISLMKSLIRVSKGTSSLSLGKEKNSLESLVAAHVFGPARPTGFLRLGVWILSSSILQIHLMNGSLTIDS
jgi:hypothetical protein